MARLKFSTPKINSIPFFKKGQYFWDTATPGLGLYVGKETKTFIVQYRNKGKLYRRKIEKIGVLDLTRIRKLAKQILANPPSETRNLITLNEAFFAFLETRKNLKPRTINDYNIYMFNYFKDWRNKSLIDISKDMVVRKHTEIGSRSKAQANVAMRFLRSIYNFAIEKYELSISNPVNSLSRLKAWYRVDRRDTYIRPTEMVTFRLAIRKCSYELRGYLLFLLFTGMRPGEALCLKWDDIDFNAKTLTLPNSKNKKPYSLPMSKTVYKILSALYKLQEDNGLSKYVFQIGYPGHQLETIKSGLYKEFKLSDLRRTFITTAEELDLGYYVIKRLLNHKIPGDVTSGYIITDVERLREPMEKISDRLNTLFEMENESR